MNKFDENKTLTISFVAGFSETSAMPLLYNARVG